VNKQKKAVKKVLERRGGTVSGTIALLAAIALLVGYFLPWTSWSGTIRSALGVTQNEVLREASSREKSAEAARRVSLGQAISGAEWAAMLDAVEESASLSETQERRIRVARLGVKMLPYAVGVLVLVLLALSVSPGRVARLGLGPVTWIVAVAQTRLISTLLLRLVLAASLIVFLTSALLVAGASVLGDGSERAGLGGHLMVAGSGVAFLSSLIGYGPGRIRALIVTAVLVIVILVGVYFYTRG